MQRMIGAAFAAALGVAAFAGPVAAQQELRLLNAFGPFAAQNRLRPLSGVHYGRGQDTAFRRRHWPHYLSAAQRG